MLSKRSGVIIMENTDMVMDTDTDTDMDTVKVIELNNVFFNNINL